MVLYLLLFPSQYSHDKLITGYNIGTDPGKILENCA